MINPQPIPALNETTVAPVPVVKSIWGKGIPRINRIFMVISLILVLGLDLAILFVSGFLLLPFWIVMLVVLGVFAVFFYLENYVFSKRFANTKSALDPWISAIIVARNVIFVLNFVPLIQILGLAFLAGFSAVIPSALFGSNLSGLGDLGGLGIMPMIVPGLFLLYIILMAARFSATKKVPGQ